MRYLWEHLEQILQQYQGALPLHHFLRNFFRSHPKLGSRDRRGLSDATYAWFRAGKALQQDTHDAPVRRLAAMYLSRMQPKAFQSFFPEAWGIPSQNTGDRVAKLVEDGFVIDIRELFPWSIVFSGGINIDEWRDSLLRQPRLFVRVRKSPDKVETLLEAAGIPHEWLSPGCLSLPNGTKLEGLLLPETYVIQDASSQKTGAYFRAAAGEEWWDCCSGAGGKSLMLMDSIPGIRLLGTDIRQSILHNLRERFDRYFHKSPELAVLDAADALAVGDFMRGRRFDGIICDVPCSGSGTWARTPENCYFFEPGALSVYTERQKEIARNASQHLKEGGRLIYITCSVFRAENEDVVEALRGECGLELLSCSLINGLSNEADSLFVAELRRA